MLADKNIEETLRASLAELMANYPAKEPDMGRAGAHSVPIRLRSRGSSVSALVELSAVAPDRSPRDANEPMPIQDKLRRGEASYSRLP